VYTATYDAYTAALNATRPGAGTRLLRDAAEKVVDEYGYSQYSFSRIQPILHGLGMNVYEPPWAPEPGMDEPNAKLKPGHVIAIEPCITLDDNLKVGGCRIGETVLVTATGYEVLTDGMPEAHEILYEN
jgi:Xaa-Pro aminopeptidase